jgi:polyvinyl alcohol dehydrogenase (cytochrome)
MAFYMRRERKRIAQTILFALAGLLAQTSAAKCDPKPGLSHFFSDGWGIELNNQRLQRDTTIAPDNVGRLKLAWSYGFANMKPRSWPLVSEDTIFIGDSGRGVVALDRKTGCVRWVHEQTGEISSAILHTRIGERDALLYLDRTKGVYVIDAANGAEIWHTHAAEAVVPMYSGTPVVHDGIVYVPLSSLEVGLAMNPLYGCCTTRGGMAAFVVQSGKELWYRTTIDAPAQQTGRRWYFIETYAPSGAPVWGAPLFDAERGLVFFGTGENYSRPTTDTSDAIFAVDAKTGEKRWLHQFTEGDAYNTACDIGFPNCPDPRGPDFDFGAPLVLLHNGVGQALLIAGQKSGDIYALNP